MEINIQNEIGLVSKTVRLSVQELIVLAGVAKQLDYYYSKLNNTKQLRLSFEDNKQLKNELGKTVGFLSNITEDIKSTSEVNDELFIIKGKVVGSIPLGTKPITAQEIDKQERALRKEELEVAAHEHDAESYAE